MPPNGPPFLSGAAVEGPNSYFFYKPWDTVNVRGQVAPMRLTLANLGLGLALAVLVIFLLLSAKRSA